MAGTLSEFKTMGEIALNAMEAHANRIGIPGAAVFFYTDDENAKDLCSMMRIVGASKTIAEDQSGYNFIALAYSKLAESIETGLDSGNITRPLIVGEYGYQGSAVARMNGGLVIASFSGKTTGDVDFEVSKSGIKSLMDKGF
ncbi:MAG: hypothetical protein Q8898_17340 [Bacillota bacterium]|nr:hypothetical protein [Bacillota bacterium]